MLDQAPDFSQRGPSNKDFVQDPPQPGSCLWEGFTLIWTNKSGIADPANIYLSSPQ